jgi:putative DNA primase/helicase
MSSGSDPYQRIVAMVEAASPATPVEALAGDQPSQEAGADACADLGPSDAEVSGGDPKIIAACAGLDHSDTDNGTRLIKHFGRDLIVMAQGGVAGGDWLAWDGRHWDLDNGPASAALLAQKVGGRIALEAAFLDFTPAEREAVKAEEAFSADDKSAPAVAARAAAEGARKTLQARKTSRWRFGVSSKNSARIKNMLETAAPHLRRDVSLFNTDPLLVVTQTHTLIFSREIDLECPDPDVTRYAGRVEALAVFRREDLATGLVPCGYDPQAVSAKWTAFLDRCMPDLELRRTVQQYSGMGLLGVLAQKLMFHHGFGANGKSVFLAVLTRVLGKSYAVGLPAESITGGAERGAGQASPDIVRLLGKRMLRVDELPEGQKLHEDLVKRLTGGDEVTVRNLFKGYFDFRNVATPHMSGNGFPKIEGTDNGIWRRMLVVHWSVTIPPEERREFDEFVDDLLTEASGILNWLIDGALDFLAHGLVVAPAIANATEAYREDMDPIGRFVAACVEVAPGHSEAAAALYDAYLAWCPGNNVTPCQQTRFGREMAKRFVKAKKQTVSYLDIRLHDVPPRPDDGRSGSSWPEGYGG